MAKATQPDATGQAGEFHSATRLSLEDLARINPLIDSTGDTARVQSVLGFLSSVVIDINSEVLMSNDDCRGISVILDICRAALECMNNVGEVDHG